MPTLGIDALLKGDIVEFPKQDIQALKAYSTRSTTVYTIHGYSRQELVVI